MLCSIEQVAPSGGSALRALKGIGRPLRGLRFGPFGAGNLLEQGLKPRNLVPVNEQPSNPHSRAIFRTLQKYWNTEHHRGGVVVATPFRHRRPPMVFLPSLPVPRAVAPEGRREKLNLQSEGCSTTVPQPSFPFLGASEDVKGKRLKAGRPRASPLTPSPAPAQGTSFKSPFQNRLPVRLPSSLPSSYRSASAF